MEADELGLGSGSRALGPSAGYRGCVCFAKAGGFGLLKAGKRTGGSRKLGMERGCKLNCCREVLLCSAQAKGSWAQRLAAQNVGDDGATPFHRCRRAGT